MPNKPILQVNKMVVGQLDLAHIPATPAIPGTSVLNGPVWIGGAPPAIPIANCMIYPGINPITLDVSGISNINGITNHNGIFNVSGTVNRSAITNVTGPTTRSATSITNADSIKTQLNQGISNNIFTTVEVTGKINSPLYTGATYQGGSCIMGNYTGNISGTNGINPNIAASIASVRAYASTKKGFDIKHPTKEDHRLRYICIEGPAAEVYFRGKLKGANVIELPEYWKNLVDVETIGVTLTPIEMYQELYVEKIEWGKNIIVKNNAGSSIYCTYVVYGERNDISKNIAEYQGLTPNDYPGDNREYNINGL
jgi:hypothetical protein